MLEAIPAHGQPLHSTIDQRSQGWVRGVGLAVAVGVTYLLVAWMSVHLLITHAYAFFWPAAGFASGILIALGPRARWCLAAGVLVAEVMLKAFSIYYDGLTSAFAFTLGNTAEPLIVAGLLERFVRADFSLGRLGHLFGLFAAASVGCAAVAIGYAIVLKHAFSMPMLTTWWNLARNDTISVILIAPLMIGLVAAARRPPPRSELIEGMVALVLLVATAGVLFSLSQELWDKLLLVVWLVPMLFWLAARAQPVFSAVGVFLVSMMAISMTIFGIGHFGDATQSIADRAAQAVSVSLFVGVCGLVLAALFAERRENEALLIRSNVLLKRERENK